MFSKNYIVAFALAAFLFQILFEGTIQPECIKDRLFFPLNSPFQILSTDSTPEMSSPTVYLLISEKAMPEAVAKINEAALER